MPWYAWVLIGSAIGLVVGIGLIAFIFRDLKGPFGPFR